MRVLVTGSSGHSGNEIAKVLNAAGHEVIGIDRIKGVRTNVIGDINDWILLEELMKNIDVVIHTASLHAPHVDQVTRKKFVDVNIHGTLKLLELSKRNSVRKFIYTSTTSVYGSALEDPNKAVWVTEQLNPIPRDIYDITKLTAERLCEDFFRAEKLECVCLRVSRFWDEPLPDKVFYRMYRGLDVRDVAKAHMLAMDKKDIGFDIFNISSQSPFGKNDLIELKNNPKNIIKTKVPGLIELFREKHWGIPESVDRVYVIDKAKQQLGYSPKFNIQEMVESIR